MAKDARRLAALFIKIGQWVDSRSSKITSFYLIPKSECFRLYVVGNEDAYDFELSAELSKFTRELPRSLPVVGTLIPATSTEELKSFFDPDAAFAGVVILLAGQNETFFTVVCLLQQAVLNRTRRFSRAANSTWPGSGLL